MNQSVKYVSLDVHKDTIAIAMAEDGKRSEVREHGEIANTLAALTRLPGKQGSSYTLATRPDHADTASSAKRWPQGTPARWSLHR